MEGTVQKVAEGYVLRFERHLAHPVEKVWAALTDSERLAEWLAPGEIELRIGGRVYLSDQHGDVIESTVTALDPPTLLEYGWKTKEWDGGPIRWELSPADDGGTHLVLTHTHPEPDEPIGIPKTLAGWHTLLEQLSRALDGRPTPWPMDRWEELFDQYTKATA